MFCVERGLPKWMEQFQLPGLWFNTSEIQALMSMDALLVAVAGLTYLAYKHYERRR